jgi:hypothetical protein
MITRPTRGFAARRRPGFLLGSSAPDVAEESPSPTRPARTLTGLGGQSAPIRVLLITVLDVLDLLLRPRGS